MAQLRIGSRRVAIDEPTYFIADISANHDGDLRRAKALIHLAAEAGADAAKFQNFRAEHIVSDRGFSELGSQLSHQARWKKSVSEVYRDATLPWEWTEVLKNECESAGIEYFSAPYDLEAVDMLDSHVRLFKIGSGDITWTEMLEAVASKGKPVLLATGAAEIGEVQRAVASIRALNHQLCLMQCNTNYTGSLDNFRHVHLNVLKTYAQMFPEVVRGLSDHTPGHATALGAIALGARMIEKHFTDDTTRVGPDHPFSMDPRSWRDMVERARELEVSLGSPRKFVAENESDTVVVQRRAIRAAVDVPAGAVLTREMLEPLRPAPIDGISPFDLPRVVGRVAHRSIDKGGLLVWQDLEPR